jgi:hypothetical protein
MLAILLVLLAGGVDAGARPAPEVEMFTRAGCPWCAAARTFLEELRHERPDLRLVVRDVGADPAALARLRELAARHGVQALGVPAFHVRDRLIVGFRGAEATGAELRALLELPGAGDSEAVGLPFVGRLSARDLGLPLFTIVLGLVDGLNPCAMWVLLFVLSLLVNLHDRPKMFLIGGTFVVVSGLVYFAFMAAWLNVFLLIGVSHAVQVALGVIATLVGALNVKDFLAFGHGPSLAIPAAAKPGLYARVRRVLEAESLGAALAAADVLAALVNAVELLCTAGLPAIYTHVLALRALPRWQHYAYLALYNVAYMLDDGIVLTTAVVTLSRHKLQERGGRWLKLVSGVVMLGLGLWLLAGAA